MSHPSRLQWPPSQAALTEVFDAAPPYTVGIEDEAMLVGSDSLELLAGAPGVLARLDDDRGFKLELPASQLEITTGPHARVNDVARELLAQRRTLARAADGIGLLASAGVHPFSDGVGELNQLERYEHTLVQYAPTAPRQLVCATQVHVSVPGAGVALAVYNAARQYLPLLAALAANAPFYEGRDTGLASVRPKLSELLPRQGVPPPLPTWRHYAEALSWGAETGAFADGGSWWWELRPHPRLGTLEFRVPDAQSTVADAAAIAAVIQSLTLWLAQRDGRSPPPADVSTWQINENRWSACRYGMEGKMARLPSGKLAPTRALVAELLEALAPSAARLGCESELARAGELARVNGAMAQRRVAAQSGGARGVVRWLVDRFLEPLPTDPDVRRTGEQA